MAKAALLLDEDEWEYEQLAKRYWRHFQPVGQLEFMLVDRIVSAAWRLRRLLNLEAQIFDQESDKHESYIDGLAKAFTWDARGGNSFSKLSRYESTIERSLYKALHELERLQARRAGEQVPLPAVLDVDLTINDPGTEGSPSGTALLHETLPSTHLAV
jgi:hypothetical protein